MSAIGCGYSCSIRAMAKRSGFSRFARSTIRSHVTRPEQTSRVSTLDWSAWASPMKGLKEPPVKSSGFEAASLRLSIDFGVKTMSGRCSSPSECWRSRWK